MTGTVAMTRFTPDAEARLEHYLSDVRAALAGASDVSPAEIEADIQAHIDAEFHAAIRPVSAGELEAVLVRLGPPEVWAVTADRSPAAHGIEPFHWSDFFANLKRRLLSIPATLWNGPEDWRLPYIAFGLFVFGIFTLPIFGLGVIFLGMSYLFGRATAELAKEKGQPLGARRWLAYPGVIAIVVPLFIALTLWPLAAIPATVQEVSHAQQIVRNQEERERGLWKQLPEHPEQLEQSRRFLAMIPPPAATEPSHWPQP